MGFFSVESLFLLMIELSSCFTQKFSEQKGFDSLDHSSWQMGSWFEVELDLKAYLAIFAFDSPAASPPSLFDLSCTQTRLQTSHRFEFDCSKSLE